MRNRALVTLAVALALFGAACASKNDAGSGGGQGSDGSGAVEVSGDTSTKPTITTPDGQPPTSLFIQDIVVGNGDTAKVGDKVTVQYVGVAWSTKKQFDASWDRSQPFPFTLGTDPVIEGWDQGIPGMRVGGRRLLIIPPELAYKAAGYPPDIGPNETLIFVIDLVSVDKP